MKYRLLFLLTMLLVPATVAFAQTEGPDYFGAAAGLIAAVATVAVPIVTYFVKLVVPKIPRAALPFVVLAVGQATTYLGSYVPGGKYSAVLGALAGLGGLWLRETYTTINEHGITKPTDPTA